MKGGRKRTKYLQTPENLIEVVKIMVAYDDRKIRKMMKTMIYEKIE